MPPHCSRLGLWRKVVDGYQFIGWNEPAHRGGLGQETAEGVRRNKKRIADKQKRYRDRKATDAAYPGDVTGSRYPVTNPGDVGQDRTRQA